MMFTTNDTGGDVQVDFSNLVFEANPGQDTELQATIIEMAVQCDASTYTQIGNCQSNETGNFSLNAVGLNATSVYYVVIDGDNNGVGITSPAESTFDITISGTGVDRPVPSVNLAQSSANICLNELVTFIAEPVDCPDGGNYYWFLNGVLESVTLDSIFITSSLQTGDVISVSRSCYLDCPDTVTNSSVPMTVFTFPIDAGADATILSGESTILNGSTTAPIYVWSPSFYLSSTNNLNAAAVPNETITYTLEATQNGCTLFDYVTITVTNGLNVPNTFSPNGDDNNDTWLIEGIERFPNNLVQIFDRWGQKIYQANGYSELKAWDGRTSTGNVAEGVYYYVIDLRDQNEYPLHGNINVIR
jgi:gliding motility-associated-like protein